jgi:ribonuclease HI
MLFAEVYTDGSCHTQKCNGAWASVILIDNQKIILTGTQIETTHNRMELLAVINSIKHILQNFPAVKDIKVISDSQYVIGLIDRKFKFIKSNYKTKAGIDIRNVDLVRELLAILDRVLLAPEIVLLVRVWVPVSVATVESISKVTLVAAPTAATTEVIPVPPTKVIVSVPRATESVPVSPAIARVVVFRRRTYLHDVVGMLQSACGTDVA